MSFGLSGILQYAKRLRCVGRQTPKLLALQFLRTVAQIRVESLGMLSDAFTANVADVVNSRRD